MGVRGHLVCFLGVVVEAFVVEVGVFVSVA